MDSAGNRKGQMQTPSLTTVGGGVAFAPTCGIMSATMRWLPRIQIAFGIWIAIAPWILGYAGSSSALWNSLIAGAAVAVAGLWEAFGEEESNVVGNQYKESSRQ